MLQPVSAAFGVLILVLYIGFLLFLLGSCFYLQMKVSAISRTAGAIAGQLELRSRSLASLAESVAILAGKSAAPKPPARIAP